jgi:hypothetical protein
MWKLGKKEAEVWKAPCGSLSPPLHPVQWIVSGADRLRRMRRSAASEKRMRDSESEVRQPLIFY